jgi:hypothetical protein
LSVREDSVDSAGFYSARLVISSPSMRRAR